jgi:flagellar motor switch protein FliG
MAVKYNVYREGTFPQFSLETYLESVKDKQAHDDPTTQRLEKLLIGLDNMATQLILRNSEQEALILSLKVMSGQLMRHILGNMSSRVAQLLAEEASHRMNIRGRDIEAAQERIIATVDNLVKRGEIIISP